MQRGASWCVFFQAEDGIRDLTVTGGQTCALPISWRPNAPAISPAPYLRSTVGSRARSSDRSRGLRADRLHDQGLAERHGCRVDLPAHLRSEEHTSELQSQSNLVCRLLLEKKKSAL